MISAHALLPTNRKTGQHPLCLWCSRAQCCKHLASGVSPSTLHEPVPRSPPISPPRIVRATRSQQHTAVPARPLRQTSRKTSKNKAEMGSEKAQHVFPRTESVCVFFLRGTYCIRSHSTARYLDLRHRRALPALGRHGLFCSILQDFRGGRVPTLTSASARRARGEVNSARLRRLRQLHF